MPNCPTTFAGLCDHVDRLKQLTEQLRHFEGAQHSDMPAQAGKADVSTQARIPSAWAHAVTKLPDPDAVCHRYRRAHGAELPICRTGQTRELTTRSKVRPEPRATTVVTVAVRLRLLGVSRHAGVFLREFAP